MSQNIVDQRWIDRQRSWRKARRKNHRRRNGWSEGVVREVRRIMGHHFLTEDLSRANLGTDRKIPQEKCWGTGEMASIQ
ncbi:hypothetical protein TIFTF001_033597 [Ficus carica]|uniref:Uncharacterized protein n=1 Tax=Ficus carica TaxID=3494 RepID=A0AA88J7T3_FICCA|nr:hypothetical protein TIFTF001_033597 [Ficus carica]